MNTTILSRLGATVRAKTVSCESSQKVDEDPQNSQVSKYKAATAESQAKSLQAFDARQINVSSFSSTFSAIRRQRTFPVKRTSASDSTSPGCRPRIFTIQGGRERIWIGNVTVVYFYRAYPFCHKIFIDKLGQFIYILLHLYYQEAYGNPSIGDKTQSAIKAFGFAQPAIPLHHADCDQKRIGK